MGNLWEAYSAFLTHDWKICVPLLYPGPSLVAQSVKNPPAIKEIQARSLGQEDSLEKEMAAFAWRIPWTVKSGGEQSVGLPKSQTPLSD